MNQAMACLVAAIALGVSASACDKSSDARPSTQTISAASTADPPAPTTAAPAPTVAATAAPPATPASTAGNVHVADLEGAYKSIRKGQSFTEAAPALFAKLGPPTGKTGTTKIFWRIVEGDKCARLEVTKDGDKVGAVTYSSVDKMMASQFEQCAK